MRIAEVAPASLTVPPKGYGGIELVVALLADGLVDAGHDVTLFASGGSRTKARLVSPLDEPTGIEDMEAPIELSHALEAYSMREEFDVVHDHTLLGPSVGGMLGGQLRVVHTLHGPWTPVNRRYYGLLHEHVDLVAISRTQRDGNADVRYAGVVHNGIDPDAYPLAEEKGDYLLFLGRSSPEKGPEHAVEIAREAGLPLKMAVKIAEPAERRHWETEVVPRMNGDEEVIENASHECKVDLLQHARATLFPIQWEEPFGLVMVESMACGTPVLACPRGAAREVVDEGVNGFFAEDLPGMVRALEDIGSVDPKRCRRTVEERFSAPAMIRGYEALFERALNGAPAPGAPGAQG
ncbi:MAG TPA: glycosyltransferase family 4 protein [Actinomycetota bacterium]